MKPVFNYIKEALVNHKVKNKELNPLEKIKKIIENDDYEGDYDSLFNNLIYLNSIYFTGKNYCKKQIKNLSSGLFKKFYNDFLLIYGDESEISTDTEQSTKTINELVNKIYSINPDYYPKVSEYVKSLKK